MTHSGDGLVAPEGTYMLVASYLLPPQPAFMAPATTLSSLQPMSNNPASANGQTGGGQSGTSAVGSGVSSSSNATATQSATGTANGGQSGTGVGSAAMQSSTSQSTHNENGGGTGGDGFEASANGALQDRTSEELKTALKHISMQAPSAWAHAPILPPSKISVASVRPTTQGQASTTSVAAGLSRKERQQQSHASTAQNLATPNYHDGSAEGSNGSHSDLGGTVGGEASQSGGDRGFSNGAGGASAAAAAARRPGDVMQAAHWGPVLEASLASQGIDGTASHVTGGVGGLPGMAALQLLAHLGNGGSPGGGGTSASGIGASTTSATGGAGGNAAKNLQKPKNNIRQTSSSFVQRLQTHTDFAKLLSARTDPALSLERHAFVSRNRMLFWLGETANGWIKEPLARLTFGVPITTHDVNQQTRSPNRLDLIIGFSSSDLVWLEAVSMRYSRVNKGGCINEAPITSVRWVPGSDTLFITSHSDGTCTLFDVTRDDSTPGSWTPISGLSVSAPPPAGGAGQTEEEQQEVLLQGGDTSQDLTEIDSASIATSNGGKGIVKSWDPTLGILVSKPAQLAEAANDASRKAWSKLNPVAHWRVAQSASINDIAFSPDHTKLAVVATDGTLRLINLLSESLEGTFQSYYGAMNRVVWSPDARFLLTAGCDDLISIWTGDGRLLSRCLGHTSFVTGLAFDPWRWRVEDRTYRFVSVGEDGKVFLWDFSSATLHRPRIPHSAHSQRRSPGNAGQSSAASVLQDQHGRRHSAGLAANVRRTSVPTEDHHHHHHLLQAGEGKRTDRPTFHSAPARGEVAELQPVASYQLGPIPPITQNELFAPASSVIPFTPMTNEASNGSSSEPSLPASSTSSTGFAVGALSVLTGSANAANVLNSQTAAAAAGSGQATAANSTSAAGGASGAAMQQAPGTNPLNEAGAANDLLIDVRCRPDGIIILHKSGTLRYLARPSKQNSTLTQRMPIATGR